VRWERGRAGEAVGMQGKKAAGAPSQITSLPCGDHHRGEPEAFKS